VCRALGTLPARTYILAIASIDQFEVTIEESGHGPQTRPQTRPQIGSTRCCRHASRAGE
jgi:hypothetical protein